MLRCAADNDVFAVFAGFFGRVHGAPKEIDAAEGFEVTHSSGSGSGIWRELVYRAACGFQT